jgi:hypothetical protein
MREHLTKPALESNDLAARMALTLEGQITWVDLTSRELCRDCRHHQDAKITRGKQKGFGRCGLVKMHTRKQGPAFNSQQARACTKFER